jgi:hypothetical protein
VAGEARAAGLGLLYLQDATAIPERVPFGLPSRGTLVLKVYGRFIPRDVEWGYWSERLAERQVSKLPGRGAADGAAARPETQNPHENNPATTWDREASDDSRGGTRTRDPGIMSAVL